MVIRKKLNISIFINSYWQETKFLIHQRTALIVNPIILIYLLTSENCVLQYVGETTLTLNKTANNLFKVNYRNTRKRCEINSKLIIKTLK